MPVEVGQAGGQVVCTCGTTLDVPTLRMLRHLPLAPTEQPKRTATWSPRKGAIAVFLIAAGVLAAVSLWNRLTEPKLPEFHPQAQSEFVDRELGQLKPVDAWKTWILVYRPLAETGFTPMQSRDEPRIRAEIGHSRFLQAAMLGVAGVCVVLAAITALLPSGKAKSGRGGEGETRRAV
jgi:multisubunit Na+/H+ antiporter MnhB subunit